MGRGGGMNAIVDCAITWHFNTNERHIPRALGAEMVLGALGDTGGGEGIGGLAEIGGASLGVSTILEIHNKTINNTNTLRCNTPTCDGHNAAAVSASDHAGIGHQTIGTEVGTALPMPGPAVGILDHI